MWMLSASSSGLRARILCTTAMNLAYSTPPGVIAALVSTSTASSVSEASLSPSALNLVGGHHLQRTDAPQNTGKVTVQAMSHQPQREAPDRWARIAAAPTKNMLAIMGPLWVLKSSVKTDPAQLGIELTDIAN